MSIFSLTAASLDDKMLSVFWRGALLQQPANADTLISVGQFPVWESAPKWAGYGSPCARTRSGRSAGFSEGV